MNVNPDRRMPGVDLPEKLRLFIFQFIDSVEMIQVLIYVKSQAALWPSADDISRELRSNRVSILGRLQVLKEIGIVEENPMNPGHYRFYPKNSDLEELVDQLLEEYRVRRQKLLELIFSPTREAKKFADAFVIGKDPEKKKGDL